VDRLACVDLPAFPLQILTRRHPEWRALPVAVVAEDKPNAPILWVDERARAARILPGQRYAHGLSLARELRAGVVSAADIERASAEVIEILRGYSPEVEPAWSRSRAPGSDQGSGEAGTFWLDAAGLERLYPSLPRWARRIRAALRQGGWQVTVCVGFSRFATYALARFRAGGVSVLERPDDERAAARAVPLEYLGIEPEVRDVLARLGVVTLGELLRLPAGGLLERFGPAAQKLHALASGEAWDPLQPRAPAEPFEERIILDDPVRDATRLLFILKGALERLLDRLAAARCALGTLFLRYQMYRTGEERLDSLRPAEPTLDARTLLRLLHLRLESDPPRAGVVEVTIAAGEVLASREQLQLFAERPRRDLAAANEALARLRAELGAGAVVKAVLREGHLPEATYEWQVLERACMPAPQAGQRTLVRRVMDRAERLPPQNRQVRDDGWLLRGLEHGPVDRLDGPYVVSGGWWMTPIHREYHFVHTRRGRILWVYYDRRRRRWFLQGLVE
jgi:protein ImuB